MDAILHRGRDLYVVRSDGALLPGTYYEHSYAGKHYALTSE